MSALPPSPASKLGAYKIVPFLLDYVKYASLIWMLLILGGLVGLAYFIFAPAIYQSRSLVDLKFYALPIASDSIDPARFQRNLLSQLGSRQMIAGAAHRMGIAPETASFEDLRTKKLRKVSVGMLDYATLQIDVLSEEPEIVREFPKAFVEHFDSYYRELRLAFMESAMQKYLDELELLKQKIDGKLRQRAEFSKENSVAELLIEQNALAQVPLDILRVQHRLSRYDDVANIIGKKQGTLNSLEELSLLESAKTSALDQTRLGSILQNTGDINSALAPAVAGASPPPTRTVVVQPAMLEGLTPWQKLEKDRRGLEVEIQEALRTYLEDHPIVKTLRNRIRQLDEGLLSELDVERKAFEVDRSRLRDELVQLQGRLPEYTAFTEKVNKLKSDFSLSQEGDAAWTQAYTELAKRVSTMEFGVDKDRVDLKWKSYSLLRDVDPISPTKEKLLMMALALGVGLAVGVPFSLEKLNGKVTHLENLEYASGYKGIGIIPKTDSKFLEAVARPNEESTLRPNNVLECYRLARAYLTLEVKPRPGRRARVILFSSARPSEGKTTMAANMAWAYQSMGQKVLLIDMDFRRGRVHRLLDGQAGPGLCQVLTGEMSLQSVLRPAMPPLWDYISRGTTVAGSSELLCHLGVDSIVDSMAADYDWIILDTPPILGLSETVGLQRMADACILVTRCNSTLTRDVNDAFRRLEKAGATIAGFILNEVDLSKISNYYYYYYSSAHYYDQFDDPVEPAGPATPSPA